MSKTRQYDDSSIVTLQGLEKITQMPYVYVGDLGSHTSLLKAIGEIVDNSLDEADHGDENFIIDIIFWTKDGKYQVAVIDTGAGIPAPRLHDSFTEIATSGKYVRKGQDNQAYRRSAGTYGIGAKATAGLSNIFCAITHNSDKKGLLVIEHARVTKSEVKDSKTPDTGLIVFHEPSETYFQTIPEFMSGDGFKAFLEYVEDLSVFEEKANIRVRVVENELLDPDTIKESKIDVLWKFFKEYTGGEVVFQTNKATTIVEYMRKKLNMPNELFSMYVEEDKSIPERDKKLWFKITAVLAEDYDTSYQTKFLSSVNNVAIKTADSHQVLSLMNVIKEKLVVYEENPKIQRFIKEGYKLPMYFCINVYFKGAVYLDLVKTRFRDQEFASQYYSALSKILKGHDHSNRLAELYVLLKNNIVMQYERFLTSSLTTNAGGIKNLGAKLKNFDKFAPCRSKDPNIAELFITEGDSAFGNLKNIRNSEYQAVVASKGKPINSFKHEAEDTFSNDVFHDLSLILGIKPGDPIEKINFKNINIVADPDAHGGHIETLIIGNLYALNPLIIDNGWVNIITSPEYHVSYKKKELFIKDAVALFEFKVKAFWQFYFRLFIQSTKTKAITEVVDDEEFKITCSVIDYLGSTIEEVAKDLVLEASLLEMFINVHAHIKPNQINTEKIKEILKYDRVVYTKDTNSLILIREEMEIPVILDGLYENIETKILPVFNDYSKKYWNILVSLKSNPAVTKVPITIVDMCNLMRDTSKDIDVFKFKGVGTMSAKNLEPTVIDPLTRSYIKIKSIGSVQEIEDMLGRDASKRKHL